MLGSAARAAPSLCSYAMRTCSSVWLRRGMSIMSSLHSGQQRARLELIAKLKRAGAFEPVPADSGEQSSDSAAGDEVEKRTARLVASVRLPAADGGAEAVAPAPSNAAAVPGNNAVEAAEASSYDEESRATAAIMQRVVSDLETRAAVHQETMRVIESSREWRDYDSHVAFELLMLKHRYQASPDLAMTAERRAQMQAHLRAKQQQVMELHAE